MQAQKKTERSIVGRRVCGAPQRTSGRAKRRQICRLPLTVSNRLSSIQAPAATSDQPLDFLQVLLLALIQALTEFLPISSSAHLYLAGEWFGSGYQGLVFDLGLHLGTLVAVLVYFRQDWFDPVSYTHLTLPTNREV